MMKKLVSFTMIAALTFGTACGGDDDDGGTGPNGDTLSASEFQSMSEALAVIATLGFGSIGFDQGGNPIGLAAQSSTSYSDTFDCPSGGTTGVDGNFTSTSTGNTSTTHYTLTQSLNACRATSSDNTTWTFDGDPSVALTVDYTFNLQTGAYNYTAHQLGGFDWAGKGKGGGCQTDLNWSMQTTTPGHYTVSFNGSTCGQNISESFSF